MKPLLRLVRCFMVAVVTVDVRCLLKASLQGLRAPTVTNICIYFCIYFRVDVNQAIRRQQTTALSKEDAWLPKL